jgi:hypothetical protein
LAEKGADGSGAVSSVGGTGTVNGITLTGTVTSTGNLTLGGALSGVDLTTQVTGTLPVANGGTGAASLTANNVILGNGTSAVQVVAPGTNGNVLTSDGTTWASTAPSVTANNTVTLTNKTIQAANLTGATQFAGSSGTTGQVLTSAGTGSAPTWADASGGSNFQEFTTSGTWTKPAGVKFVMVEAWGAGGGGGGGICTNSTLWGSGGGGGGSYDSKTFIASTLPATVPVVVGARGFGGASVSTAQNGLSGSNGGTSTFGTGATATLVAGYGGGSGAGGNSSANGFGGGGGGVLGSGFNSNGGPPQIRDLPTNVSSDFQPFGGGNQIGAFTVGTSSGFGGGAGAGGGQNAPGGSYLGGGGGGASNNSLSPCPGGTTSTSVNNAASGGNSLAPAGANGLFGCGGGAGIFSELSSGTTLQSVASVGAVVVGATNAGGYYRYPTADGTAVGYPLPVGMPNAVTDFGLTSSSTEFVMVANTSCFSSTDGISWTQRTNLPFNLNSAGVIRFVNGVYFIFSQSGGDLATSTDLNTWTVRTSQINAAGNGLYDVAWNGTVYIIVGDGGRTYTSSDLTTWTLVTISAAGTIYTVQSSNTGRFVGICTTAPFVRYSDNNGAPWTSVTALSGFSNTKLLFANNTFVFAQSSVISISTNNGITWTAATEGTRFYVGRPIFTGTFFVMGASGGQVRANSSASSWIDSALTPQTNFPGGAGGNGGIAGGGGAGGQSRVGFASGKGGDGGNGLVRVYFW